MLKFDLPLIIVILSGIAAFASVLAVTLPFLRTERHDTRLKSVAQRRQALVDQQRAAYRQKSRPQPRQSLWRRMAMKRFNLEAFLEAHELRMKLARAGWRGQSAAANFIFARLAIPIVVLVLSMIYVTGVFSGKPLIVKLLAIAAATGFGVYLPQLMLTNRIQKRQQALTRAFPDTLDLMVICVESGLSIEAAFAKASEQMAESAPIMAEELGLTTAELAFLGDRRQAYENLAARTGLPSFKSLASTLSQAEKYGTPVAVGLRVIAQENRDTRMAAAEKKAAALPAKLTVPMILFFLPVLFLIIAGPAAIQIMETIGK